MSDNPNFVPLYSTDEVYVGADSTICLTDELIVINDTLDTIPDSSEFASASHTHNEYALSTDLTALEDVVDTKANATHTHSEYATSSHTHNDYATVIALDALGVEVDEKADVNHTHTGYASSDHIHTEYSPYIHSHDNYAPTSHSHTEYAEASHIHDEYSISTHTHTASEVGAASNTHNHDSDYANISHNHENVYAVAGHDHDGNYAAIDHAHSGYATTTALNEVSSAVSGKANASHTHNDIYYTETEMDTRLASKSDTSHTHTGVYDASGAASSALASANAYTDSKIDALVGDGASTTLDTIGEISSAIEDNQDAIDLLNSAIANKANVADFTSHTGDATVHVNATERNNWNVAKAHADTTHAPSNAEANQNAFSNVVVGNTTISADTKTDTLTLVAGSNITLTPNVEGDSITIASTNTVYTHPTSAGNKHIPAGGSSGQILRWSADGAAVWGNDNNTTYSNATQTTSGLMSGDDKIKLDGVAEGANNYVLPSAGSSLGGVKSGGDVTISSGVITINDDSHNHVISNIDSLQTALDGKASSGHNHDSVYYTEDEVDTLLSGKANSSHTHTITNVSGLQSALNEKASASHGTHVSYSTTIPVMDGTASIGTASTVARSDHKHPTDITRASQTDLDALEIVVSGKANASHSHVISDVANLQATLDAKTNQNAFSNVKVGTTTIAADTTTDTITLVAGTNVTLNPDATGDSITISSTDTNTTYSAGTGISLSGTTFSNSGVRSVATGSSNGTISVNTNGITTNVEVKGLGSAAYTASTAYDAFGSANTALVNAKAYTDEVAEGKANASHTHIISNIINLQTTLDGKAASNHTHSVVTTSTAGLMSASDKSKLDGIANGANAYTLPTASSTLGGVKTTSTVTSASGYTACPIINGVPYYKDTNTTYNLGSFGITATSEELNYMDGVTSNVQTQLNTKASSSHTHNYAGSSSVGGAATSANKLNTNAGSANQPVYFANGVPVTCAYTIGKSVPSDAKFTDTTYGTVTTSTNGLMSASDKSKLDGMVFATVSEVETYLTI